MAEKCHNRQIFRLLCFYVVFAVPYAVNGIHRPLGVKEAVIEIIYHEQLPSGERATTREISAFNKLIYGVFARAGSRQTAKGILFNYPPCDQEDQAIIKVNSDVEWISVLHFPSPLQPNDTSTANGLECLLILDRVKKAVLFGASAIIILAMNPNILQELDIAQLFSHPIVIVEDASNITVLLRMIKSGLKVRVKITYGSSLYDTQTFTIWSACWRARPGSGVVCMSDTRLSKVDPNLFWSYFYSALAVIMLLLLIKTKSRQYEATDDDMEEESKVAAAWEVLSSMKIKRYRKSVCKYDDSERDTCAICLDQFYHRQKIRILPCIHEFHTKCVDPWLLRRPICPLCKLNVLESKPFGGFLPSSASVVSSW